MGGGARPLDSLHAAGFTDLNVSHIAILLYPGPEGRRPSELAAQRHMSRQAVNYLLGQNEELGYLERHDDPADRRSKLITLTPRGRRSTSLMRNAMADLERECRRDSAPRDSQTCAACLSTSAPWSGRPSTPSHQTDHGRRRLVD